MIDANRVSEIISPEVSVTCITARLFCVCWVAKCHHEEYKIEVNNYCPNLTRRKKEKVDHMQVYTNILKYIKHILNNFTT